MYRFAATSLEFTAYNVEGDAFCIRNHVKAFAHFLFEAGNKNTGLFLHGLQVYFEEAVVEGRRQQLPAKVPFLT